MAFDLHTSIRRPNLEAIRDSAARDAVRSLYEQTDAMLKTLVVKLATMEATLGDHESRIAALEP
jgi:hypothetical protein